MKTKYTENVNINPELPLNLSSTQIYNTDNMLLASQGNCLRVPSRPPTACNNYSGATDTCTVTRVSVN